MASSMYALPLYFPTGTKVDPIGVMYSLTSYHGEEEDMEDVDPVKQLNDDQLNLIKLLEEFNDRLDKHLSMKKEGKEKKNEGQDKKKNESKGVKSDSRSEKVAGVKEKGGKTGPSKTCTASSTPWKLTEEKVGAETNNGISACASPSLSTYTSHKMGVVSVTITADDVFWMETLAKVGVKRDIKFSGEVSNGVKKAVGEVEVKKGASFSLIVQSLSVCDRVTAWKILGGALGLFSFDRQYAVQNAHSHRWLTRLDEVIKGGKKDKDVSSLVSLSSQFLSRFDSLSSHSHFSLPDVLIRSLATANLPNNVELWAKRLDSLL